MYVVLSTAESAQQQQQQQQRSSSAGPGDVSPLKTDRAGVRDRSTAAATVWRMRRFGRNNHATTAFNMVARDGRDNFVSTAKPVSSPESPTEGDRGTDVDDGGYAELQAAGYFGPGRRIETEWTRVAEVLDRVFFFIFLALLVIPTATILGIVRLFKPEL